MRYKVKKEIESLVGVQINNRLEKIGIMSWIPGLFWGADRWRNEFKELSEKVEKLESLTGKNPDDYKWEKTNERKLVKIKEQKLD